MVAMIRPAALALVLGVMLTACGAASGWASGPRRHPPAGSSHRSTDAAPSTAPTQLPPRPGYHHRPRHSAEALIYAAALGGREAQADIRAGNAVWIRHRFCNGMIELDRRGRCDPAVVPRSLQLEIRALVGRSVHFTARPPEPSLHAPVITLGQVRQRGDRAEVAIDVHCGPLCGRGETLVLTRRAAGWTVTGQTGMAWIS